MTARERHAQHATADEVLGPWMQSLATLDVRAVFVLGPDFAASGSGREVVAVSPEAFRGAALAMAWSTAYGPSWRQAQSPLVAWKNFVGQQPEEERPWVDPCLQRGALSMVRVDFPTSLDHGFECIMLVGRELADQSQVHAIAYSAQAIWPLLKEQLARRLRVSSREREVLLMLADGYTVKEVGGLLGCAERTVTFHVTNVMAKLRARNQRSLILRACSLGLI